MIFFSIDFCSEPTFLGVIFFIKQLLKIAWILIPMGLIVMAMVDLAKSVLANGTDEMTKNGKVLIKRVLMCLSLYLIPTLVNFVINLMGDGVLDSNFVSCYQKANLNTIFQLYSNKSGNSSDNFDDYVNSSGGSSGSNGSVSSSSKKISSIRLDKKALKLQPKKYYTLTAIVSPPNTSNKNLSWKSSNPKVAIVNQNGKVTALKKGKTTITVSSSNGKKAKCTVTVSNKASSSSSSNSSNSSNSSSNSNKSNSSNNSNNSNKKKSNSNIMEVPDIKQTDSKYDSYRYPGYSSSRISGTGSGFVSLAMVIQYLTKKDVSVETVATWAANNGYFNGQIAQGNFIEAAAKKWNLGNVKKTKNLNTAVDALKNGKPVISYQGPGVFTSQRHYIVLSGIDSSGDIHVNDPNGNHTRTTYTKQEINKNNNNYYIFD